MLRQRPTYEELLKETKTSRLRIISERQKRTQQGILIDDVDFDDFDLSKYDRRNPNKATQTDMFNDNSNSSSVSSNRSVKTAIEGHEDKQQDRQISLSSGESLDDVRYRTRMSIADDLETMARVGGSIVYYTGQGIGQGINMAIDAYNWMNDDNEEDEEPEPPIDEDVFENTRRMIRRGASRSRSPSPEEQASGSNDAIRLLRRGASRSRSEIPPKRNPKKK